MKPPEWLPFTQTINHLSMKAGCRAACFSLRVCGVLFFWGLLWVLALAEGLYNFRTWANGSNIACTEEDLSTITCKILFLLLYLPSKQSDLSYQMPPLMDLCPVFSHTNRCVNVLKTKHCCCCLKHNLWCQNELFRPANVKGIASCFQKFAYCWELDDYIDRLTPLTFLRGELLS